MSPQDFVNKWRSSKLKEEAAAQPHFLDLCRLLGVDDPISSDPTGKSYTFEKHVKKVMGNKGFADVWKRGCFGWEYKGKGGNLEKAYLQLLTYKDDLENPPLLIISDINSIEIRTQFLGVPTETTTYKLDDLLDPEKREKLRQAWLNPESFNPRLERTGITEASFITLRDLADYLKDTLNYPADKTAHFLVKVVFSLYAEDEEIVPQQMFLQMLRSAQKKPNLFKPMCEKIFAMMSKGGYFCFGRSSFTLMAEFLRAMRPPELDKKAISDLYQAAEQKLEKGRPCHLW
ncbi:MAG: type IIL restriction-modification enzyme MmeI [Deinococcales bacterium]